MKKLLPTLFSLFSISSANAYASGKLITYSIGDKQFEGYLVEGGKKGSILVVHNWLGITDETKSKVEDFAKLGYTVFAADIFGKGIRPKNPEEAKATTAQFYGNRNLLRERAAGAFDQLVKASGPSQKNYAVAGYCFGGTTALELARSGAPLKAVLSFHGGLDSPKPEDGKNIKGRVLALHGADDPFVPAEKLKAFEDEMRLNKVDWTLIKFGGAVHSFTDKTAGTDNSKGAAYNENADKRSWKAAKEFLTESFSHSI